MKKTAADYVRESYQKRKEYRMSANGNRSKPNGYITQNQRHFLFAKASKEIVWKIINEFGYDNTKTILKKDFDDILKKCCAYSRS